MEGTRKWKKTSFSTILWAVLAILVLGTQAGLATEVCIDFEDLGNLANGDCVEGLGTVHDLLDISDAIIGENLILIQEGTVPKAYTGGVAGINECLDPINEDGHGFGIDVDDDTETENLKFTFDPDISVTSFSIRLVDYGDNFPYLWNFDSTHTVRLVAYNRVNEPTPEYPDPPRIPLDIDELTFTSTGLGETITTLNGVDITDVSLSTAGDACFANTGEPGQWMFSVSAEEIVCVELQFINDSYDFPVSTDSDVAFDDICFTYGGGVINVDIDIKPGSYPNSINLGSHGVVPVAILSTLELDATTLNAENIFLAGSGVRVRGKGNKYLASEEDVNGDSLLDLVVKVQTENLDPGAFQDGGVFLRVHETSDPESPVLYEGWDEINIVPPE